MGCKGTSTSNYGDSRIWTFKEKILVSIPSVLRGHVELYNVFELLLDSSFDKNLGFVAHALSRKLIKFAVRRCNIHLKSMQG